MIYDDSFLEEIFESFAGDPQPLYPEDAIKVAYFAGYRRVMSELSEFIPVEIHQSYLLEDEQGDALNYYQEYKQKGLNDD